MRSYGPSTVRALRFDGGVIRGDSKTAGQKAAIIGGDSLGARVDGRIDFDSFAGSANTVAATVTDGGVLSSFPMSSAHRTTAGGSFELLAGGGIILPAPGGSRYRVTVNDSGQLVTTAL
jgi:hypothetical protein